MTDSMILASDMEIECPECPVCKGKVEILKYLPCKHEICLTCLKEYVERTQIANQFECPVRSCKATIILPKNGISGFETNRYINREEDTASSTSVKFCDSCDNGAMAECRCDNCEESYCSSCSEHHRNMKASRDHTLTLLMSPPKRKQRPYILCSRHPDEEIKKICIQCDQLLCIMCSLTEHHQNHPVKELEEGAKDMRRNLTCTLGDGKIKTQKKNLTKSIVEAEGFIDTLRSDLAEEIEQVKSACDKINNEVKNIGIEMQRKLTEIYDRKLDTVRQNLMDFKSREKELSELERDAEEMLSSENDQRVIPNAPSLCESLNIRASERVIKFQKRRTKHFNAGDISHEYLSAMVGTVHGDPEAQGSVRKEVARNSSFFKSEKLTLKDQKVNMKRMSSKFSLPDKGSSVCSIQPVNSGALALAEMGTSIFLIDQNGRVKKTFNSGSRSGDIAADVDGKGFFIACPQHRAIKYMSAVGEMSIVVPDLEKYPHGVALDKSTSQPCKLYLSCSSSPMPTQSDIRDGYISTYSLISKHIRHFAEGFKSPGRLTVSSSSGHICVCDSTDCCVSIYAEDGTLVCTYRGEGSSADFRPTDVCFDKMNNVIIANPGGRDVRRIDRDGKLIQILLKAKEYSAVALDEDQDLWVGRNKGKIELFRIS